MYPLAAPLFSPGVHLGLNLFPVTELILTYSLRFEMKL
jgi:hypothetical protein